MWLTVAPILIPRFHESVYNLETESSEGLAMEMQLAIWGLAAWAVFKLGKGAVLLIVLCLADTPKKRARAWN